ncbi:MAG: SDR family NAD(P)-dependent oxidoreductase, partial [Xanthomonadales bacterium]|nr:SDR family NAD(P)-dependent oxidoreductase [Xanthomonadales bacterium]
MMQRWRLDGQTALVCGASQGIGAATARELAALGADLLLVARDETVLTQFQDELESEYPQRQVRVLAADLADAEDRLALFDWISDLSAQVHLLINNVGGNVTRPALDYALEEVRGLIE